MQSSLQAALRRFLQAHHEADLVEAVIDTSVGTPWLNLWAWRLHPDTSLDEALAQVDAAQDWGLLKDIVDELGSSTFEIALAGVYPHWPEAIAQGDQALIRMLEAAAAGLPAHPRILFHHVDAFPAISIRPARG